MLAIWGYVKFLNKTCVRIFSLRLYFVMSIARQFLLTLMNIIVTVCILDIYTHI